MCYFSNVKNSTNPIDFVSYMTLNMVETKTQKSIIRQKGFQLAPEKHKHQNNTTETQDKPF